MAFITIEGEDQIAAKQGASQILDITHFVLANIAGLGAEPVNRIEAMPAAGNIMATLPVTSSGYVNGNQVVYSLVMDSSLGDYDFNWVGLKDADGVLIACTYTPLIQKRKTTGAIPGNNLTRNFLIAFSGILATTAIAVPAETWQIDFNARLWGIDERERLSNYDIYGHEGFFGDGWKVTRQGATTTYDVAAGVGYVGGVRIASAITQQVTVSGPPKSVWLDVSLQGDISDVSAVADFVVDAVAHADYTDANGFKHYVTKIADIAADGSVTDVRVSADADPHPQYATKVGVQSQSYTAFTAGGTVDALTGTIPSTLTALADKMQFTGISAGKNLTSAPTLNLTLGSTATGAKTIVKGANQALVDGDISGAGYPCQFEWNSTFNAWVLLNPATGVIPVPSGAIAHFAMASSPSGWLKANGAAVSRTTYAALFAAIGTTFGAGNGSTTFNLPDLRGEFLRGWDDSRGVDTGRALGTSQGHQLQDHNHAHGILTQSAMAGGNQQYVVSSAGAAQNTTGISNSGSNPANYGTETRPRNIALLACIKY
jgi:microcystin-dependent protein